MSSSSKLALTRILTAVVFFCWSGCDFCNAAPRNAATSTGPDDASNFFDHNPIPKIKMPDSWSQPDVARDDAAAAIFLSSTPSSLAPGVLKQKSSPTDIPIANGITVTSLVDETDGVSTHRVPDVPPESASTSDPATLANPQLPATDTADVLDTTAASTNSKGIINTGVPEDADSNVESVPTTANNLGVQQADEHEEEKDISGTSGALIYGNVGALVTDTKPEPASVVALAASLDQPEAQTSTETSVKTESEGAGLAAATEDNKVELPKGVDSLSSTDTSVLADGADVASEMSEVLSIADEDKVKVQDLIETTADAVEEADSRVEDIAGELDLSELLQASAHSSDGFFGIGHDGTINANAAATQMTDILSAMAAPSNPLSGEEKSVLHSLLSTFVHSFTSDKSDHSDNSHAEIDDELHRITHEYGTNNVASLKDELMQTQTLLAEPPHKEIDIHKDANIVAKVAAGFVRRLEREISGRANNH